MFSDKIVQRCLSQAPYLTLFDAAVRRASNRVQSAQGAGLRVGEDLPYSDRYTREDLSEKYGSLFLRTYWCFDRINGFLEAS